MDNRHKGKKSTNEWGESISPLKKELNEKRGKLKRDKQMEEEPFIALGRYGEEYYYWVRSSRRLVRLIPDKHTHKNLYLLAPSEFWGAELKDGKSTNEAWAFCLNLHGDRLFNPDCLLGAGVWYIDGVIIYNSGGACYRIDEGKIIEIDHVLPNGKILESSSLVLSPDLSSSLTDAEGKLIQDLFDSWAWRERGGGMLFLGLIVQGILSGMLPFRAHGWVNAPAGTGKTELKNAAIRLFGNICLESESNETTEAGIRSLIGSGARLLFFDEAEMTGGAGVKNNISHMMGYIRSSSTGSKISKGSQSGKAVSFTTRSSFILFSINNQLNRDADRSRFLNLHLEKLKGKKLIDLMNQQKEIKREFKEAGITPEKILSRLLLLAPVIHKNSERIREYLEGVGHRAGRLSCSVTFWPEFMRW